MSSNPAMDIAASIVKLMDKRPELFEDKQAIDGAVENALKLYAEHLKPRVERTVYSKAKAMRIPLC